ncbi:hypothetical protein Bbelb_039200 [Branchiostoma belcheri]|nr:hypothetical protein Bbelb_039200 [Branchiostoma belcheri]
MLPRACLPTSARHSQPSGAGQVCRQSHLANAFYTASFCTATALTHTCALVSPWEPSRPGEAVLVDRYAGGSGREAVSGDRLTCTERNSRREKGLSNQKPAVRPGSRRPWRGEARHTARHRPPTGPPPGHGGEGGGRTLSVNKELPDTCRGSGYRVHLVGRYGTSCQGARDRG